jgi:hypothetical protein
VNFSIGETGNCYLFAVEPYLIKRAANKLSLDNFNS